MEIQADLDELKLEVQDRESARSREVEFMKASGGKRDWLMGVVVITGLLLTVGVVAALIIAICKPFIINSFSLLEYSLLLLILIFCLFILRIAACLKYTVFILSLSPFVYILYT